jgi:hypothetical protein
MVGTTMNLIFEEPGELYHFTIGPVRGYTATPSSGSVTVNRSSVGVFIIFTSTPVSGEANQTPGILGLPGYEGYVLIGTLVVLVVIAVALAVVKRQGRNRRPGVGYPPA